MTSRRVSALLALATFLIVGIGLPVPSIWTDEAATISAATRTLPELGGLVQHIDAVHGTYYAGLHLWFQVLGVNVWTLRLPSLIAVALSAGLVHRLALRWMSGHWAVVAAMVFALGPRTSWSGIEGRSWAWSTLLAILATMALVKWVEDQGTAWLLLAYAAALTLGIYLHLYLIFLIVAHAVTLLMLSTSAKRLLAWCLTVAASGLASLPLVLLASSQTEQVTKAPLGVRDLARVAVNQFYLGETPHTGTAWKIAAILAALLGWTVAAFGLRGTVRAWALPWLFAPTALVLGWSALGPNMYHPRYFAFCAPALALLITTGLRAMRGLWRGTAVSVLLVCVLIVAWSQRQVGAKSGADYLAVVDYVGRIAQPDDAIYYAPNPSRRLISIAYPGTLDRYRDLTLAESPAKHESLTGSDHPLHEALSAAGRRILVIVRSDQVSSTDDNVLRAARYQQVSRWDGGQNTVFVWVKR